MKNDLLKGTSATQLAEMLASQKTTSHELVLEALMNIKAASDQSIFISLDSEKALEQAKASDQRRSDGKLLSSWDGIPIAWKDLFDIEGLPTTAGSAVYKDAKPAVDNAYVVSECKKFGLISIGKTNLSEFAYSGLGLNPHFGTPRNPACLDVAHIPGGSSSGSAVAVASNLVPIAIGTDTAGSVRVPASFCGIVGYKSSQNRYPNRGIFPLSTSLDSVGSFAHCVSDIIQIDAFMRGKADVNIQKLPLSALEFIIPQTIVFDDIAPDIAACFENFVSILTNTGVRMERSGFPIFDEIAELFNAHGTLTVAEAFTYHEDLLNSPQAELMDQRVRERMLTASNFTTTDYIQLQWARERLQRATTEALGNKLLLFPTTALTAPKIAELEASDEFFIKTNLKTLRNTMLGNYLGTPGVSLPIGHDSEGLPIGALISAPFGLDDCALSAALAMEEI